MISEDDVQAGHGRCGCKDKQAEEPPHCTCSCQIPELICTRLKSHTLLFTCSQHGALAWRPTVRAVSVPTFVGSHSHPQETVFLVLSPERTPAAGIPPCTNTTHLGYTLAGESRESCITPGFVYLTVAKQAKKIHFCESVEEKNMTCWKSHGSCDPFSLSFRAKRFPNTHLSSEMCRAEEERNVTQQLASLYKKLFIHS